MREIRFVLVGLGNLGRRFCELLVEKDALLRERYGLRLKLVGAADSRGTAYAAAGLDPALVAQLKREGRSIADYPGAGRPGESALALVAGAEAELLLEASPVNLAQGAEPGLSCTRTALKKGMHVSTPNKGPLVLAFRELHDLAAANGVSLRFDGTVTGGLPAINLGQRELRGAVITRVEAVPNLVTGYIMDLLTDGVSWNAALAQAQAEGVLEADASWDLEGWDAAAKLVILTNAVLEYPARLEEVERAGIAAVPVEELRAARQQGRRYRLLATAERDSCGGCRLSVKPMALPPEHPLGHLGRKQMGVVYHTDIFGSITALIEELTPVPSAASMLRDIFDIFA
ncbi:MAG: Homoserine dehydrogenase [Chloroflexi bacterium ADurb.Bin222]|nr:MAG: Homoserine dehydrogenase [Chloroflexi bacterium ADurb.Bin222]